MVTTEKHSYLLTFFTIHLFIYIVVVHFQANFQLFPADIELEQREVNQVVQKVQIHKFDLFVM